MSAAIVLYLLGDAVVRGSVGEMLLLAPWPLLALWAVYVSAFTSRLAVDDDGATVQNLMRIVRVPWSRVIDVQWRWQVQFDLDDGTHVRAIGGPALGRSRRRPGSLEQTPATVRAQFDVVRSTWARAREREREAGETAAPVTRRVDLMSLVCLVVLVVWAVVAVLVTGGPGPA